MSTLAAQALDVRLGGRRILHGVDLTLRVGEVTAIVGPNGAGKSTLLACLSGLRRPAEGQVRLADRPVHGLGDRERARRIGYLPQAPEIAWGLDVRTFVSLGRTAHRGAFGESASDGVAITRALQNTALVTLAERDVTTLSGGERARALMARALAGEPEWLLADEPLTGLDPGHQLDAGELLRRIASDGAGVVVTLHDLAFAARVADRVVVLAEGRILADARPSEALAPQVLAQAYAIDARWIDGAKAPAFDLVGRHV